ncbi:hypothetical protein ACFU6K_16470 [Kitasatospora sp. NPDC057512]
MIFVRPEEYRGMTDTATPPAVLLLNDQGHLPEELHWTGYPPRFHF